MTFKQVLAKEILFYWCMSSCIIFIYAILIDFLVIKILSSISIILSKIFYERYVALYYSNRLKNELPTVTV